ncbi:MAG: trypsin-like peptidase domain-containing protein [Cyanobacteria bacterium J06581_3]
MNWSGKAIDGLHAALLSAYPQESDLKRLVRTELDIRLNRVASGSNYSEVVFELIESLEAEDRLDELLSAARRKNPTNKQLQSLAPPPPSSASLKQGPDFQWRSDEDDESLEGLLRPGRDVDSYDVAFLQRMSQPASAVCRVELAGEPPEAIGTGFLVAPDLLLTNHHVIAPDSDSDPNELLDQIILRFEYLTLSSGQTAEGKPFRLASNALVAFSPVKLGLDYALLRIEERILEEQSIHPIKSRPGALPGRGMNIHILQHPEGRMMQVSFSNHGITGVYRRDSLIQYVSETSIGSSGSPCFNDRWELVALHHAQFAASFGVKCEGILYQSIYEEITSFLPSVG